MTVNESTKDSREEVVNPLPAAQKKEPDHVGTALLYAFEYCFYF
jgi:hypothetical protein